MHTYVHTHASILVCIDRAKTLTKLRIVWGHFSSEGISVTVVVPGLDILGNELNWKFHLDLYFLHGFLYTSSFFVHRRAGRSLAEQSIGESV